MFMSRVKFLAALLAVSSATATGVATAQDAADGAAAEASAVSPIDGAVGFVNELTAAANVAMGEANETEAEKLAAFQMVMADGLALETIGKFMIGDARKTMSEAQLERYNSLFPDYITKLYAEQFDEIIGKPLEVLDAKTIGARDVIVRTQFPRSEGSPIMVDWRIRELRSGGRKAIDIIVSGVSIMLVKREEFSAFIAANGVDALLDRLEQEAA